MIHGDAFTITFVYEIEIGINREDVRRKIAEAIGDKFDISFYWNDNSVHTILIRGFKNGL